MNTINYNIINYENLVCIKENGEIPIVKGIANALNTNTGEEENFNVIITNATLEKIDGEEVIALSDDTEYNFSALND